MIGKRRLAVKIAMLLWASALTFCNGMGPAEPAGGGGDEATSDGGRGRVHQGGYWKAGAANLSASGRLTPSLSATCLALGPVLTFVLPYAHCCLIMHISTF